MGDDSVGRPKERISAVPADRHSNAPVRQSLVEAAEATLRELGYSRLSTRRVAERAGVPLSQIHYHFGSKQQLILAVLEDQNRRLLHRQERLYGADMPLWRQWEQACAFLEEDLESGYVRILQEMIAAGWSDPEIAEAVRGQLRGWIDLLNDVARRAEEGVGGYGPFTPEEVVALVAYAFVGIEATILLGVAEEEVPGRAALRKVGELIRTAEEARGRGPDRG